MQTSLSIAASCVGMVQALKPVLGRNLSASAASSPFTDEGKRIGWLHVPDSELQAVLFDVDGTLLKTDHMYYLPWVETAQEFGLQMSKDHYRNHPGPPSVSIKALFRNQKHIDPAEEVVQQFQTKLRERVATAHANGTPEIIPAVFQIAKRYKDMGVKTGIATTGFKDRVEDVQPLLEKHGFNDLFDVMVFGSDVAKGKPHPDVYLEAARRLGVDATKCRAYEDIDSGLKAAHTAGMEVIDVTYNKGYPKCQAQINRRTTDEKYRTWTTSPH